MAQDIKINGVTYNGAPSVSIPKAVGNDEAVFFDTSGADAAAGDILSGKTAFGPNGSVSGSMTDNGTVTGTISAVAGEYTIPAGKHSGSGKVKIDPTEQAKIISGNIKKGATILGVNGSNDVVDTSDADATASHILSGKTAYVGGSKVVGALTTATVSQDSVTKVVHIA